MCNNGAMTGRRLILLGLLVIAAGLILVQIIRPDAGLELLCYAFAVPVMVVNMWEWTAADSTQNGSPVAPGARQLVQTLRDRWLSFAATLQGSSLKWDDEEKAAPAGRPVIWNKLLSIRAFGTLLIVAGVWIMAAVFSRLDFGIGKLMLGMLGFIAFTTGLYFTFG